MTLGIETALEGQELPFIAKYRLMKDRLLNFEYEHWAAGFPEGNNHGRGHIQRVLEYLDQLLGPKPLDNLNAYELFLAMMAILYHDIGMIKQRHGHADVSRTLLEEDSNDAYIVNPIDKEIISAAVVSHSSSKDIEKECSHFSEVEILGSFNARPRVIAALVRLADELDEDHRRADRILQTRLGISDESKFFWRFCQCIRGIRPDPISKKIDFNIAFSTDDIIAIGDVPSGKKRHFVSFFADKLAKINSERVRVNRFLPPQLRYYGIHIDVKPLRGHPTWNAPRTFVFNDRTSSTMFLDSFPEILAHPMKEMLMGTLELIAKRKFDLVDQKLDQLASVIDDLPVDLQLSLPYTRACSLSLRAEDLDSGTSEQDTILDAAAKNLIDWYTRGSAGGWKLNGRTDIAEVHRMAADRDLAFVVLERKKTLKENIPVSLWPTVGSYGGCVPVGTLIDTPNGQRLIEELRPGDVVISVHIEEKPEHIKSTITAIVTSRSTHCVRLNHIFSATPSHRIRTVKGWVTVGSLRVGEFVMDRNCALVEIKDIEVIEEEFDVFDLAIDAPCHNFIANGLLCHNKTRYEPPISIDGSRHDDSF